MSSDNDSNTSLVRSRSSFDVQLIDVPDLVNLIADFCDDQSVSKLSRVIILHKY